MIDNFNLIAEFIKRQQAVAEVDQDQFFFGQILLRKKDGAPLAKSNNQVVRDLVFRNSDEMLEKRDSIVAVCGALGARAYVNVNPRYFSKVAIDMAGVCLDYVRAETEIAVRSAFATACGRYKRSKGFWVVDIDSTVPMIEAAQVAKIMPQTHVFTYVPTVNGCHLLTRGFDLRELRKELPHVTIHKNNPTLLYWGGTDQ